MKNKYKNKIITNRTISTAIFEYLEKRGYKVNRKKGIFYEGSLTYDNFCLGDYIRADILIKKL